MKKIIDVVDDNLKGEDFFEIITEANEYRQKIAASFDNNADVDRSAMFIALETVILTRIANALEQVVRYRRVLNAIEAEYTNS